MAWCALTDRCGEEGHTAAQEAADLDRQLGQLDHLAVPLIVLGQIHQCNGRWKPAFDHYTEALAIADEARKLGFGLMVGNMGGSSLAMAPSFVVGQLCDVVDLDGPLSLVADYTPSVVYEHGSIWCPDALWGSPLPVAAQ